MKNEQVGRAGVNFRVGSHLLNAEIKAGSMRDLSEIIREGAEEMAQ